MQNKINIGIIGKNFGYNVIYKSFIKNKNYRIKGFCFKSKKVGKLIIPKNIKIYSSWKKLILDKKIDAVAISSPPKTHEKIVRFAIKKNKHIFCEKPLGCSYNNANFLCNLIKNKKISHMVNYEFADINAFQFTYPDTLSCYDEFFNPYDFEDPSTYYWLDAVYFGNRDFCTDPAFPYCTVYYDSPNSNTQQYVCTSWILVV